MSKRIAAPNGETKFWFRAWVLRKNKNTQIEERVERAGAINAKWPMDALDLVAHMAVDLWKVPLLKIELYEMHEGGELVASTSSKMRINTVLKTHRELDTGQYKNIEERRKLAVEAGYPPKKEVTGNVIVTTPTRKETLELTEWTWCSRVGTYFTPMVFATLKLDEGMKFVK